MKIKTITTNIVAFMALLSTINAGLIISQYVETNSGSVPKGIELWNNTGDTIDFTVTPLTIYNARTTGGQVPAFGTQTGNDFFELTTGTLADGAVMVVGTSDMGEYLAATFPTDPVQFHAQTWYFNGDDAIQVRLNGVIQDTFGEGGVADPGTAWRDSDNTVETRNHNLALLTGVTNGDINGWTDPSLRFDTVKDDTGADVAPNAADGLSGFGVAPIAADNSVDTDGDGVNDGDDAFPSDPSESADADSDGVGDNADAFPSDPNESADADSDGVGDNADAFDDDPNESADTDSDGVGDNADSYAGYDDALIGNFLTDFPQSGGGSGDITQEAYDAVVAEKDQAIADLAAAPTQQDLLDARVGSAAVSVTGGTATITLQVEQSDDNMQTWSTPTEGATSVNLPVSGDATFFRVRAQ